MPKHGIAPASEIDILVPVCTCTSKGVAMAEIRHEIKIKASQDVVFDALTTVHGLTGWHSSEVSGNPSLGGVVVFNSSSAAAFEWEVTKADKLKAVEWRCVKGPGNSVGTAARFYLSEASDGRTQVELFHSGWPDEHGNFRKCNTLWGILLHHLRKYAETGKEDPAF